MDELLTKAMKYYNNGKKLYETNDKTKAKKMFEHSLNAINEFKKINPSGLNNINTVVQATEVECIKYLNVPENYNIFNLVTKNNLRISFN